MDLDKKRENSLYIIKILNDIFELSESSKKQIFDKLINSSEEDRIKVINSIKNYIDKKEVNDSTFLMKLRTKNNNIEELIDSQNEWEYNNSIINNL